MVPRVFRMAVVTLSALFVGGSLPAQQPAPIDVVQELQAARTAFQPASPQLVARLRTASQKALATLEGYLNRGGQAKSQGWRKFLHLDLVAQQLRSASPDLNVLEQALANAESNTAGLERPPFIAFRRALRDYVNASALASNAKANELYASQLDALAAALEGQGSVPEREQAIEGTATWLIRAGQAPRLVAGLRQRYSHPNFHLRASGRLVKSGFDRPVDETRRITDVILGTRIYGDAHTSGTLTSALIPSEDRATFELRLQGITRSKNVGYNGPVTIYSTALTQLTAGKRVYFDVDGFESTCAWARCDTDTNIYALCARCALVERIGWRRVGQQQGQAEQIASRHAEVRVVDGLNEQVAKPVGEANDRYRTKFVTPLLRRDAFPPVFRTRTTTDAMYLTSLQASASGLGAPDAGSPPPEGYDIAVSAHQSSINNFAASFLAGYVLTDLRLVEMIRDDLKMEVPPELQQKEDDEEEEEPTPGGPQPNWTITFSQVRPFAVTFTPGQVAITIRGDRFTSGSRVIRKSMEIGAVYKVEQRPEGPTLVRQGEVDARYVNRPAGERESAAENSMKTIMRRKFSAMFKPEFPEPKKEGDKTLPRKGIELPGRWAQGGPLMLQLLDASEGWIGAGLNQVRPASAQPIPTTTAQRP